MKPVFQTKFGKLEGNCFSACIASILECSIEEIPCFLEPKGTWYQKYKKWLVQYNLDFVAISNWEGETKPYCPDVYCIVSGMSPRNLMHSVVFLKTEMVHDPHPEGGGVKDITDWIYIVPKYPRLNHEKKE
ncbi:MAG: hypothetical protein HQ594_06125 [Candidatus Omnitrophica bacterium]|nr:hypothetical protein [Candidatus Omnitrophota bacterium]